MLCVKNPVDFGFYKFWRYFANWKPNANEYKKRIASISYQLEFLDLKAKHNFTEWSDHNWPSIHDFHVLSDFLLLPISVTFLEVFGLTAEGGNRTSPSFFVLQTVSWAEWEVTVRVNVQVEVQCSWTEQGLNGTKSSFPPWVFDIPHYAMLINAGWLSNLPWYSLCPFSF